ncbi:hypothetical protein H257_10936 [Aphanomyces astaci]|uniref:Uncharacterized protein n=1 Tax=Aphanomyces astaci TaxID=112090 RepID=W4G3S7_APHAT|nr:hypothetical protein H257_10936 [Aphanomyces astaci]ETV74345.1 hypothetical protein H257_10936 [Aphanomyces astaci]|eukprot:XP_009836003.1 hypothetical protein H257_10936 [Aphanomyces astaci]
MVGWQVHHLAIYTTRSGRTVVAEPPAGTMELRPVNVTRTVYKTMLIDNVISAIKARRRHRQGVNVRLLGDEGEVPTAKLAGLERVGYWFLLRHPTLQQTHHSNIYENIVNSTNNAWNDVAPWSLEHNFQPCLREVNVCSGENSGTSKD